MTSTPLRVGLLGASRIAPAAVIRPARKTPGVTIAAVAARDDRRGRRYATKYDIPTVHDDYQSLISDPAIDAVYVPLPNGLHGQWTIAAMRQGKHVLCEKPLTANAAEARVVEAEAHESGSVMMEAVHYRYHPVALRMIEIVRSGEIGALRHVEAALCAPYARFSDIRYRLDLAGGALMDPGCYAVHMVRTVAGAEPEVVSARAELRPSGIDRAVTAELAFPGGVTGRIVTSLWSSDLFRLSVRAVGERGEMRVFNPLLPQLGHRIVTRVHRRARRVEHLTRRPSYAFQLDAFAAAVRDGTPVLTNATDAVRTMSVIDAVYDAAGLPRRQPVPVPAS
ncbi:Gfo/Idh/MocA family oxidoreductase [Micromonospora sp. NPDC049230]|uniref:Gfo/Idh/MocA family protein n=1 Tax=Micromonospora sp. NPDC049230 TaxID=3155502 RepID=UPI0033D800E6